MMRGLSYLVYLAIAVALTPLGAVAQPIDQKDVMKQCNAQAKEQALRGDSRKTFMSTCLSNH